MKSIDETIPSLPPAWFGFLLIGALLIFDQAEFSDSMINYYEKTGQSDPITDRYYLGLPSIVAISIWIYWFFCIHRFHKILMIITSGSYDIKPMFAIVGHFIPFFNFYWIFYWPNELTAFINSRSLRAQMPKGIIGFTLLLGMLIYNAFSGVIGLLILFGVIAYINKKLDKTLPLSDSSNGSAEI